MDLPEIRPVESKSLMPNILFGRLSDIRLFSSPLAFFLQGWEFALSLIHSSLFCSKSLILKSDRERLKSDVSDSLVIRDFTGII